VEPAENEPDGDEVDGARLWSLPASRKPVPELVEERVLELLRSGELRLGDRLPNEPELARLLGVGRSSVRTALQKLQGLGVVEVNRGRGWFVSGEPRQQAADLMLHRMAGRGFDIVDVMEVRVALEGSAAALAAVRASPGQLDEIAKLSRTHQDVPYDDREQLLRTDEAFHSAIVDASGNAYLRALYGMVIPLIADWRRDSYATPEIHDRSGLDHNQIVVQLRRRDEVGARLAMTSHLMGLYKAARRESGGADEHSEADVSAYVDVRDTPLWSPS
jgi:GntR family transcriptional repressor for pyruvate dehydrogenase complex